MADRFDVIVAGGGMAGLTAATLLAARGFRTLLLEKRPSVGGYLGDFRRGPWRFDSAASFLGGAEEGGELAAFLDEAGLREQIRFAPVLDNFRLIFPRREYTTRGGSYVAMLQEAFPDERAAIEKFAGIVRGIGADIERFGRLKTWQRALMPLFCPRLFRYARSSVGSLVKRMLRDPDLQAMVANFPATAPPDDVSLLFAAVALHKSERGGVFYPVRGMGEMIRRITDCAKRHGAEIRTGDGLTAIEHDKGRIRAARTDSGERLETRAAIIAFNPADALALIAAPSPSVLSARERATRFRYSASAFVIYLGLKPAADWSREFFFTSIFETPDMDMVYRTITGGQIPESSIIHVTFPGAADPDAAGNAPTAKIVTPMPYEPFAQSRAAGGDDAYHRMKQEWTERLIEKVCRRIPSLRGNIGFVEAASPLTLEAWTGNRRGAMYGLEPTPNQFGPWRWPNRGVLDGLYFCGHYTRPAHGIVGACFSGRFAARFAEEDLGKR